MRRVYAYSQAVVNYFSEFVSAVISAPLSVQFSNKDVSPFTIFLGARMATKKVPLLEQLRTEVPPRSYRKNFTYELPDTARLELDAVRDAFNSGQLRGWTIAALFRRISTEHELSVGFSAFYEYIVRGRPKHGRDKEAAQRAKE